MKPNQTSADCQADLPMNSEYEMDSEQMGSEDDPDYEDVKIQQVNSPIIMEKTFEDSFQRSFQDSVKENPLNFGTSIN